MASPNDGDRLATIYAPIVEGTAISFETQAPSGEEMAERISETLITHPWLVCEDDRGIAGYAYGCPHRSRSAYRWSCDVSVYVSEHARGKGVGRKLYETLFSLLKQQGFVRAHAGIVLPNAASVGLHEACGFEPIGIYRTVGYKFGQWHDVGWWARPLGDPGPDPSDPMPWSTVASQFT
ncbi:MAG: arsinothricin resistance N-acetyltransferase ArsN1 family B [Pseudomonadota bacterium]